jgi:hypothetical protein
MPNGADKNLARLAACVSVYHARFRTWPTHARLDPLVLWDIANHLEAPGFEKLGRLMELRTQPEEVFIGISVGGSFGVVRYEDVDYDRIPARTVEQTERWLPLGAHSELRTERGTMSERPVVPVEEADFRIRDDGVSFHVRPTSEAGKAWVAEHIDGDLTGEGGFAVEPRSLDGIEGDIEADGLKFGPHEGKARVDFFPGEHEDF